MLMVGMATCCAAQRALATTCINRKSVSYIIMYQLNVNVESFENFHEVSSLYFMQLEQ